MTGAAWFIHERGAAAYGSAITQTLAEQPGSRDLFIRTPPLVSVVISCYNYGRYLPDAIHSLIGGQTCLGQHPGQSFQAFDVTIVDDRGTDDSWQIAQSLADNWKGIHAIQMPKNGGTAAAMNYGIKNSYGRFIQAMDADDMLEPDALAAAYDVIQEYPDRVIYSDYQIVANGQKQTKTENGKTVLDIWKMQDYDFDRLLQRNHVPCGLMFSRKGWQASGGYPEAFGLGRQDWAFAIALGRVGYCGQHIPKPLYLYRREGQNRTLRNTDEQWMMTFRQQLRDTFPDLYRGERPMGCCGGGSRRLPARPAAGATGSAGAGGPTRTA